MTLEKAIEILGNLGEETVTHIYNEREDAIKLGIEALKWWRAHRLASPDCFIDRLPGETEN